MHKINKRKTWSALIITMVVIMIVTSMMIYFLEKIVPISKNVIWIENSTIAYYEAQSWIEEALLGMSWSNPALEPSKIATAITSRDYWFQVIATWTQSPRTWEWNSEFNPTNSWYRIWPWEPFQVVINDWIDLWNTQHLNIALRTPNLDGDPFTYIDLKASPNPIVSWTVAWSWRVLYSSWWITPAMITNNRTYFSNDENSDSYWSRFLLTGSDTAVPDIWLWVDLELKQWKFKEFYKSTTPFVGKWLWTNWASCANYKCSIKFSVVAPLIASDWKIIPYLEMRFSVTANSPATPVKLPYRYTIINADGYSYWFKRHISRDIMQQTTNEALDFTIFQ